MTVRRGTDFRSAAAPGIVDRVRTAHLNTKIMLRIRPTVFDGEMIEGHHLCRRRRWSPQESEWTSNSKHVDDMPELCRLKLDSTRTPTLVTKATGKRRRDIDDALEQHDVQVFKEAAGTGASPTGASSITVYNVRRVSGRDVAAQAPGRPENVVCLPEHGLGSRRTDQENCVVYCGKTWQSSLFR